MKIVIFANTSWYIFNFRKNLILTLLKADHQIFIIAPPDDYVNNIVQLGVKYYPLTLIQRGKNPFREIVSCVKLFRILKTIQPDVALTFTVKCNLYTGLCCRLLKFKQIANISGLGELFEKKGFLNYVICRLYKFALKKAKLVFFQNNEDMQTILQQGLLAEGICKRIPGSGVDLKTFRPASSYIVNKPLRFFMFGRLVPKKGYDLFLQAAENIALKQKHDAEFWIMGIVDKSREESKRLLERILALHKKGIIKYLPPSDDVTKVLQQIDVVVLPSKYNEGVPRTLLEAMACEKPIITTDWKGCRNTVDHSHNGYLINVDDYDSLEGYIVKLINTPSQKLREMGKAGRQKAEAEFDENMVLDAYLEEIYKSALLVETS
ncbi:MAG: glycosyltransferase family 4 protein [Planctomycetes bacterium]|nr:glycosyltransferase family 4 protein [Planctomycetota bacterium]